MADDRDLDVEEIRTVLREGYGMTKSQPQKRVKKGTGIVSTNS